jgi:hypothetical protein
MTESWLRWQGRISGLRGIALVVGLGAVVVLLVSGFMLVTAIRNASGPRDVSISQLVSGDVGNGYYVRVSGVALYDSGYEETEDDGTPTRNFYYLLDPGTGGMVLIQHTSAILVKTEPEEVTITGMTRSIFSDLKSIMREDETAFEEAGVQPSWKVFVKDGDVPPSANTGFVGTIASAVVLILCFIPFFFPALVYAPHPVDATAPLPAERPLVYATGRFAQLTQVEPTIEIGRKTRKFNNVVANFVPMSDRTLMVYIHHVLKSKAYGITVRTEETDWAVFIDGNNVQRIEPGRVYSWKDRLALRFEYAEPGEKTEELYLLVDEPGDQRGLIIALERIGFSVATPTIPQ